MAYYSGRLGRGGKFRHSVVCPAGRQCRRKRCRRVKADRLEIVILLGLILLNGVFAMSELAVVSSRKSRLSGRLARGERAALAVLALQDDPSRFLSTVQIGITLIGIGAGAYGATSIADDLAPIIAANIPLLAPHAPIVAFSIVIVLTTFLSVVVGELAPKRLALIAPEAIAMVVAPPMAILARAMYPVVFLLRSSTEALLGVLGLGKIKGELVTEEEIEAIIEEGASSGALEVREHEMMRGVMRLADRDVRSIMTPRRELVWIDADDSIDEIVRTIGTSGHSRFPLARGDLDHIIGVVQTKDLLARSAASSQDVVAAAHPVTYVPETVSVMRLLETLNSGTVRMGIVIDEHGEVQGIVTAADLLGAIAGAAAFAPEDSLEQPVQRADGSWLIDGRIAIDELERLLGEGELAGAGFSTAAGLLVHHLERLPELGDSVIIRGWRFEAVDLDGRRVDKLLVQKVDPDQD